MPRGAADGDYAWCFIREMKGHLGQKRHRRELIGKYLVASVQLVPQSFGVLVTCSQKEWQS